MSSVRFHSAGLLLCAILLAACAAPSGPGSHAGQPYLVNSQRTLFYSFGPSQSNGPDFALYHGERVTMLSYQYGYSHIVVEGTGQSGYVATEDLTPAPPAPKASPTPLSSSRSRHHHASSLDSLPPTPADEAKVPLPEFPESEPPPGAPRFRY